MSFFKELKEDIAQSVSELTDALEDDFEGKEEDETVKKASVEKKVLKEPGEKETQVKIEQETLADLTAMYDAELQGETADAVEVKQSAGSEKPAETDRTVMETVEIPETAQAGEVAEEKMADQILPEDDIPDDFEPSIIEQEELKEDSIMSEDFTSEVSIMDQTEEMVEEVPAEAEEREASEEITVITQGTTISGSIKSDTSLMVKGTIEGDVECQGKLTIVGRVAGNTIAKEIYVNTPRLEGDINSQGIVKIDVGTVVIGNVNCTSVVVAGAVKGNIEVNGPVIVDSTAVVKGDIRAKSVQVNSGAVIDGKYSLAYADVDLDAFFEQ